MKRAHHSSLTQFCPRCIQAQEEFNASGHSADEQVAFERSLLKSHYSSIRRAERENALRSLGLKKVRGALGGTYWE